MEPLKKIIKQIFTKPFPQSYLINQPFRGAFIFFIILFLFVVLYRPLEVHQTAFLNFYTTALIYCAIISLSELLVALLISRTNFFSKSGNWTIGRELLALAMILNITGISVYFAGFLMETESDRLNFSTFFNSYYRSVLLAMVPVIVPSLLNIRYAFAPLTFQRYENNLQDKTQAEPEKLIHISSRAKKEHLSFCPGEFIYAESKGNYVIFHLKTQNGPVETSIRNSITEIENQLSSVPGFMRIHRAFIVNLHKITSRDGNAMGYRLTLKDCNDVIPVSRQNTRAFEQVMG